MLSKAMAIPYLTLSDLQPRMRAIYIVALVVDKSDPEYINDKLHAVATLEDHTGRVSLNLWRQQVDQVDVGDVIRIKDGFTRIWDDRLEVSTWQDIEVL